MTETALLQRLLIRASELGWRLFRNNVGVLQDARGNHIRYGLCVGSSDLIGWTPVVIGPEHIGRTLAVFTAIEAKVGQNQPSVTQDRFLAAVQGVGGIVCVARSAGDLETIPQPFLGVYLKPLR